MTKGDDMAYHAFHAAYFDRLSRYLFVASRGSEDAMREALQETFRRVVRYIRPFSDDVVFWSWLTVLARSALSDQSRKRRRYLSFLDRFKKHSQAEAQPVDCDTEDRLNEALETALALLDADERTLVEWKYFDCDPVREIAARLATTESAVESRLVRIRRKLKDGLAAALRDDSEL